MAKKDLLIEPAKEGVAPTLLLPDSLRACPNIFRPVLVVDDATRAELRRVVENADRLAVDTETTGLAVDRDKVIGVCIAAPPWDTGFYMPMFNSPEGTIFYQLQKTFDWCRDFLQDILESDIDKIFHNMLFDVPMLYFNFGIRTRKIKGDTMLKSHVIDADSEHGLKELAVKKIHHEADWYEAEMKRWNKAVGGSEENPKYWLIPAEKVADYGAGDVVFTGRLDDDLEKLLLDSTRAVYEVITMPLAKNLLEMRTEGVKLDRDYLEKGEKWYEAEMEVLMDRIRKSIGDPSFNPSSPDQLRDVLYKQLGLPGGRKVKKGFSTDEQELKRLKGSHPVVDHIIEFRGVEKLKGTYFTGLLSDIGPDGFFRTDPKVHGTRTGRLSMARLHQIPHGPLVRRAFIAEDGYVLVGGDHSQLEARVLTHYSQDKELLKIYREDRDIHSATAKFMLNLPCPVNEVEDLFPEARRLGKCVNFALLYLETVYGLAKQLECSTQQAEEYYKKFFELYRGIKPWAEDEVLHSKAQGYVEMLFGRRRYIPDLSRIPPHRPPVYPKDRPSCYAVLKKYGGIGLSVQYDLSMDLDEWTLDRAEAFRPLIRESGRQKCADCKYLWQCYYTAEFKRLRKELEHIERQAVNTKIQGSAADLTNLGIVRTGEMIQAAGYEAILTNYVHDEVIFRVPVDSNVDLFKEDFGRAMMSVQEYISVPLKFQPKVAKTWAKLK